MKKKDEFPSITGTAPTSDGASQATFNPFAEAAPASTPAPAPVKQDEFKQVEGILYCRKNCKVVSPDYTCVVDYMTDNNAVDGLDCCASCLFKQELFVKKIEM